MLITGCTVVQYRSPIDYSEESLLEAKTGLERLYMALKDQKAAENLHESDYTQRFKAAMDDDFNTPVALSVLYDLVRDLNKAKSIEGQQAELLAKELLVLAELLGVLQQDPNFFLQNSVIRDGLSDAQIKHLIELRTAARNAKNFARSDEIRDQLAAEGIELLDSREGTSWTRC
jgi:cysteinyl-tRNA synthetase